MTKEQPTAPGAMLDHIALHIQDLDRSARFYGEILGLQEIPCPLVHRPIRWFSLGKHLSIHLIEGSETPSTLSRNHHIALQTNDFDSFVEHLERNGVEYYDSKGHPGTIHIRRDGYRQIFFQDPDDFWLEINDVEIE